MGQVKLIYIVLYSSHPNLTHNHKLQPISQVSRLEFGLLRGLVPKGKPSQDQDEAENKKESALTKNCDNKTKYTRSFPNWHITPAEIIPLFIVRLGLQAFS